MQLQLFAGGVQCCLKYLCAFKTVQQKHIMSTITFTYVHLHCEMLFATRPNITK
jgi:hypothetical protein